MKIIMTYGVMRSFLLSSLLIAHSVAHAGNSFSLITYNVAGLWEYISQSDPKKDIPQISPKLNRYDLCVFQEDFNYHKSLFKDATHRYRSDHQSVLGWGSGVGDGLSRLSRYPFTDYRREKWKNCHGFTRKDGADCLTPKGFSFARYHFKDDVVIDIYNLHADAGSTSEDHETRTKNIRQLLDRVNEWSKGHAVIIAGDTNSRFYQTGSIRQLVDAGFSEAWTDMHLNGKIPEPGNKVQGEVVDKIFYRSTKAVHLTVSKSDLLKNEFTGKDGKPLSDHDPLEAIFGYEAGEQVRLLPYAGGTGYEYFNDLPDLVENPEVKEIRFSVDDGIIRELETAYLDGNTLKHGQPSGRNYNLALKKGEYITHMELCEAEFKSNKYLSYLSISTSQNKSIAGGQRTAKCWQFSVPAGWKAVGFWGQKADDRISGVGFIAYKNK